MWQSITRRLLSTQKAITDGRLDASGAAETNRDACALDDHRNVAAALAELEHPLQVCGVLLHVDVVERYVPPFKILTGGEGVRSSILAENQRVRVLGHVDLPPYVAESRIPSYSEIRALNASGTGTGLPAV